MNEALPEVRRAPYADPRTDPYIDPIADPSV